MKNILFLSLIITIFSITKISAQGIGEVAPEKPPEVFPPNAWGIDIMFGDAGFGLGTFFRKELDLKWTAFIDLSFSEAKDEREIEYFDYYKWQYVTIAKKNRIFQVPVNVGLQYRLFEKSLTDNLRPYLNGGVGPTVLVTTPYSEEFFKSFSKAQAKYALGGYIGFGANFGLDKSSLVGVNFRYYYTRIIDGYVESLEGKKKKDIQGFFITLNLGLMY
ncbi:MAG: hypothetical protein WAV89_13680 [Ignavibacteriaceae bacterium]